MTSQESDTSVKIDEVRRVFLVVIDESEEMSVALKFAALRAKNTGGRVALLQALEPQGFEHWVSVGELMREEARAEAEENMQKHAAVAQDISGVIPMLFIREGKCQDELIKLIDEEESISVLILGASLEGSGPGPLISSLTSKQLGKLRIPLTIVPGNLDHDKLCGIT